MMSRHDVDNGVRSNKLFLRLPTPS